MSADALRVRRARVAIYGPVATGVFGIALVVAGAVGFTLSQGSAGSSPPASSPVGSVSEPSTQGAFILVGVDAHVYPLGNLAQPRFALSSASDKVPAAPAKSRIVGAAGASSGGLWLATADGHVYASTAAALGSATLGRGAARITGITNAANGNGYRLVAADGHVYSFGVPARGQITSNRNAARIVGIASSPNDGYWIARSDGTVTSVGAPTLGHLRLRAGAAPVVGIAASPDGRGYWLATADGHVFAFGVAGHGELAGTHARPHIVGIAPSGRGGYWLTATDGRVYPFDAPTFATGSARPPAPIVAILPY
ncbi:MAG TPA: hypothetical protein VGP92_15465 [Acidimicrobiia bacterium]|nr:hypothetical protein [Acidimicrobiia bacterium]